MGLVDVSYVRDVANLPLNAVPDAKISAFFTPAQQRLTRWVGSAAYADALLATPVNADRKAALKFAEAMLVAAIGLPHWNAAHTGRGAAVDRSAGRQGGRVVLLTPDQVSTFVTQCLQSAENAVKDYLVLSVPQAQFVGEDEEDA